MRRLGVETVRRCSARAPGSRRRSTCCSVSTRRRPRARSSSSERSFRAPPVGRGAVGAMLQDRRRRSATVSVRDAQCLDWSASLGTRRRSASTRRSSCTTIGDHRATSARRSSPAGPDAARAPSPIALVTQPRPASSLDEPTVATGRREPARVLDDDARVRRRAARRCSSRRSTSAEADGIAARAVRCLIAISAAGR